MQWLQVVVAVFYSDLYNVTMDSVLEAPEIETATWLTLAGVLCLAVGMRSMLSAQGRGRVVADIIEVEAGQIDPVRLMQMWVVSWIVATIAEGIGWYVTALHQFLVPFSTMKWVFFFMVCYRVLLLDKGYGMMSLMVAIEFFGGFLGFFSSYKEGLFMFLIAAMTIRRAMNIKLKLAGSLVFVLAFVTSVFWSSIKMEYREFVRASQHRGTVEKALQRLSWLESRVSRMDAKSFDNGMRALVARVQYVTLFGHTISHVPHFEPYAKGELWFGAVKHVLMPRFIFRNKSVLDDSERARRFTGVRFSGSESGTSIGIGYMAQSYADFGRIGMFVPVFLLGAFFGRIYQVAIRNRHSALLGTSVGTAMLFSVLQAFATSNAKILGSLVVLSLAYWMLNKTFGAQIMRWLKRTW
ncbi:hypothetical protein [Prosthecobacter sp.]|uniref:hypothetical protein n=1 Tax=Prosthecobacter sp. TaxID=1965333 RepID=UPI001D331B73|nr:hypothetical protein [Prosthecobacter sp.]MCB1275571.1 hypothetical protein [Prosthecobacter sp.]